MRLVFQPLWERSLRYVPILFIALRSVRYSYCEHACLYAYNTIRYRAWAYVSEVRGKRQTGYPKSSLLAAHTFEVSETLVSISISLFSITPAGSRISVVDLGTPTPLPFRRPMRESWYRVWLSTDAGECNLKLPDRRGTKNPRVG